MDPKYQRYGEICKDIQKVKNLFLTLEISDHSGEGIWNVKDYDFGPMRKKYGHFMSDDDFSLLRSMIPNEYGYTRSVVSVTYFPESQLKRVI